MNHFLQGIPGSQTLPAESCPVLPRSEPSYVSQIIRRGELPAKSLTLSETTGPKNGKSLEMQTRSEEHDGEYGAVNKEVQPYTRSSLLLALLLPPLLCFGPFFLSSLGFLKKQETGTVREKVKKVSKTKFNNFHETRLT